ncbi:MAG TPA: RDD family protein [Blastocatellia bacterium]|nr:RDD family protein [Blastocatellia bacterium]
MLDDELVIETPERVELRFILASVGNRFIAAAIDHLIQVVAALALLLLTYLAVGGRDVSGSGSPSVWAWAVVVLILFTLYWGYFAFFETIWSGQTPGKRIMRLRVIREDGRPVRFFEAFVRNLLRPLIDFMPFPSYAVGVVSIIFSSQSKRVGDFVAGTVVVKERSVEAPSLEHILKAVELEQRRPEPASTPQFRADTNLLSEQEIRAVQAFLLRRYELPDVRRQVLAARIAGSVAGTLGIFNPAYSPEAILEEVDRQYRVRTRYSD